MLQIRRAQKEDAPEILRILRQISTHHAKGRPDIFIPHSAKYTVQELEALMESDEAVLFVAQETPGEILGYAISFVKEYKEGGVIRPHKLFYLDDLCVDEGRRGQKVGQLLLQEVEAEAKRLGCAYVELNVWLFNEGAVRFYEKNGFTPRCYRMEKKL